MVNYAITPPAAPAPATKDKQSSSWVEDMATEGSSAFAALISIRWFSVLGQASFILIAYYLFAADLQLAACLAVVATGAIVNIGASLHRKFQRRLKTVDAFLYLAFDILQISLLLSLTGGLDNPFAMFLITPVAVSANFLRFWAVAALAILTILCLTVNAIWHEPLPWTYGSLEIPTMYGWLVWLALTISVLFISTYSWSVARSVRRMRSALNAAQMELASAGQITAMGALAAAVAHEMGTPLATISLVAKELLRDSTPQDPAREDLELLVSQAERCRKILADFGQKPSAEGGAPYTAVPLAALIEDVALPHRVGNIQLALTHSNSASPADEWISIRRKPEFLHGVGNVLQNAFQFAKTTVGVDITTTPEKVGLTIWDDGPGFSAGLLQKIGEPYISTRAGHTGNRQSGTGGHMGLGVFIAKTLLERTGARVNFANRPEGGARITLIWPRTAELFQVQGLE